jgi:hypothetical protein
MTRGADPTGIQAAAKKQLSFPEVTQGRILNPAISKMPVVRESLRDLLA